MQIAHRIPGFFLLILILFVAVLGSLSGCGSNEDKAVLKPGGLQAGDLAYNFSLMSSSGQLVKLSQMSPDWYLVLVFYRGYWCSVCQEQLAELKTDYPIFTVLHTTIAAISVDELEDSADFNRQWNFPFPLLSDPQLKVIDAYGARHVGGHGIHDIARPTIVIIDPNRKVRFKYIGKNAADSPTDNEILYSIQQIQKEDGYKP
jgi:peroxiredoxin